MAKWTEALPESIPGIHVRVDGDSQPHMHALAVMS